MALHKLISAATTFLFVQGNRPEPFEKTHRVEADIVIINLKDVVSSNEKAFARENAAAWLTANPDEPALVRLHPVGCVEYERDVGLLNNCAKAIILPQTECAEDLLQVQKQLGKIAGIAVIETSKEVFHAEHITSTAGVTRLAFGKLVCAAERGVSLLSRHAWEMSPQLGNIPLRSFGSWAMAPVKYNDCSNIKLSSDLQPKRKTTKQPNRSKTARTKKSNGEVS